MTELLFIRHGETDWNRQQRFQGQLDVPLNAVGEAQARRLAARLAGEPPDLLVTSDLERARQTAAPLAQAWGQAPLAHAGLREQGFGIFEGLDLQGVTAQHAALWDRWLAHDPEFAPPGGESTRQFHARVLAAVRELAQLHGGRRLAVVTHGGVLDMLWRTAWGLPLAGPRECAIPNAGINRLRWAADGLVIETWADDGHLHGLAEQPATVPLRP